MRPSEARGEDWLGFEYSNNTLPTSLQLLLQVPVSV